jgi:hypothetical protein
LSNYDYNDYNYGDYVEVSDKEITNVPEESFAVGDLEKGDFILVSFHSFI